MKKQLIKILSGILVTFFISMGSVFAWDSYSGVAEIYQGNPLHEDITQFAYARLILSDVFKDENINNILNYNFKQSDAESYKGVVEYLRQGAYWNDFAASTFVDFGVAFKLRNFVPEYKGAYSTAYDVGKHLEMARPTTMPYWSSRYAVRFEHNGRGNFLHGMLGIQADGKSYVTQEQQKEFEMQWIEVAYKYAQGKEATLNSEQKLLLTFINPYEQLKKKFEGEEVQINEEEILDIQGNELDEMQEGEDVDGGVADVNMTDIQMRLRAVGMICHTIEDSYNPAHLIRANDTGKVLAFGKYENQKWHPNYDHIADADGESRKEMLTKTASTEELGKIYGTSYLEVRLDNLKTLGLAEASSKAYEFLDMFAKNKDWSEVKVWLDNEVYVTDFTPEGHSKIAEGGRRVQNIDTLKKSSYEIKDIFIKYFGEGFREEADAITKAMEGLVDYQNKTKDFYKAGNSEYKEQGEREKAAFENSKAVIDNTLKILDEATRKEVIQKWSPETRGNIIKLAETNSGFVREFAISQNLGEEIMDEYQEKANKIINYVKITADTVSLSGKIQNISDNGFLLDLETEEEPIWVEYDGKTVLTAEGIDGTLKVGQSVNVTVSINEDEVKEMECLYEFKASEISIQNIALRLSNRGIVKELTGNKAIIAIDDKGDYTFIRADSQGDGIALGDYVHFEYNTDKGLTVLSMEKSEKPDILEIEGEVIDISGSKVVISVQEETYTDIGIRTYSFDNTYMLGKPMVGGHVQVYYYIDKDSGSMVTDRIISGNHEHSLTYVNNDNGTHTAVCTALDYQEIQNCVNETNKCSSCGYEFKVNPTPPPTPVITSPPTPENKVVDEKTKETVKNTKTGIKNDVSMILIAGGLCLMGVVLGIVYKKQKNK